MVLQKRKLMVVCTAIAAAFALPGCAPAGYNGGGYGSGAQPAANAAGQSPGANAGDAAAGDSTGDNSAGDAGKSGDDTTTELPADKVTDKLTGTKVPRMGEVIENGAGFVFYRFDKDTAKPKSKATCNGDCAKVWHPALTNNGKPQLKGIDRDLVGTVTRADGTKQLTVNGWPIYTYIGDKKPGTWKGQNVAGSWFVIKPDGTKNLTCLPAVSKPVAPPADDSGDGSAGSSSGSGSDYSY